MAHCPQAGTLAGHAGQMRPRRRRRDAIATTPRRRAPAGSWSSPLAARAPGHDGRELSSEGRGGDGDIAQPHSADIFPLFFYFLYTHILTVMRVSRM